MPAQAGEIRLGMVAYKDLSVVTLVAHTCGAMVATAPAECAIHRQTRFVFIGGLVPGDGE